MIKALLFRSEVEEILRWAKENNLQDGDLFFVQAETPEKFLELNPGFVASYIEALAEDGISYAEFCSVYKGVSEPNFSENVTKCAEMFGMDILVRAAFSDKYRENGSIFIRQNPDGTLSVW